MKNLLIATILGTSLLFGAHSVKAQSIENSHYVCVVVDNGITYIAGANSDKIEDGYEGEFGATCTGD